MLLAEPPGRRFQFGGERIVPAIEEAEHRNRADDLDDLVVVEMRPQAFEIGVCHRIGHQRRPLCNRQGGALGVIEQGAGLELPDGFDPGHVNTGAARRMGGVGGAVVASGGAAGDMGDQLLEAGIDARVGAEYGVPQGHQRRQHRRAPGHGHKAVGHEPHDLFDGAEQRFESACFLALGHRQTWHGEKGPPDSTVTRSNAGARRQPRRGHRCRRGDRAQTGNRR